MAIDKMAFKKIKLGEETPQDNLAYWLSRSVKERIEAVEILRREYYGIIPRKQKTVSVVKLGEE
jgi:hypothetical protein